MVNSGRLLFEGQKKGRDEGPSADHDEEWQAGDGGHMPGLRHQDLQDRKGSRLIDFDSIAPLRAVLLVISGNALIIGW